jgi:cyclohexanone monooxygenase
MPNDVTPIERDIDLDAIRARYARERDKRVRREGEAQYAETAGEFARFADGDPFAPPGFEREPLVGAVEAVVIGGGWAGLITAARLREAGISDVRVIEAGSDFGGTWYWNRYPGAQCDVESYCYLPLLEETNYIPKEKYAFAPEIFAHAQRIGRHFGLYENACFRTRVLDVTWDEAACRWLVRTNRDDALKARFVFLAIGPWSRAKLPNLLGLKSFKGHSFHTSRWDYDYTGGDHTGNLHKLADKRVAVIGTGATAIQCVPHLAAHAKHLYVFQRTPSSVDVRGNKPTDPEWARSLTPGWQRERQQNFNDAVSGRPVEVDLVSDGWTDIFRKTMRMRPPGEPALALEEAARLAEIADAEKMDEIRNRVNQVVRDKATAEVLKPWFRQFCKRPCFNDDYLEAFNRPNVTMVDTSETQGVERVTENCIVANGAEYEVDCIVFATGFEINTTYRRRLGIGVYGRGGVSLYDYWGQGMRTFHGYAVHGFPNWFAVGISQNGVSLNYSSCVDEQAQHLAYVITTAKGRQATRIEATAEAEEAWVDEVRSSAGFNLPFLEACTPGYYNNEGKVDGRAANILTDAYAPGANAFHALLEEWRRDDALAGLDVS